MPDGGGKGRGERDTPTNERKEKNEKKIAGVGGRGVPGQAMKKKEEKIGGEMLRMQTLGVLRYFLV